MLILGFLFQPNFKESEVKDSPNSHQIAWILRENVVSVFITLLLLVFLVAFVTSAVTWVSGVGDLRRVLFFGTAFFATYLLGRQICKVR
jgi:hypothetical protein